MILEAIVTTTNPDGSANIAPMGPEVGPSMDAFVLRPFRTSTTYANLARTGEGVLHVTDDALMLAKAAIGMDPGATLGPAGAVKGHVILGACRYHEFRAVEIDDREDRVTIRAEVVATVRLRDAFGWNRAQHAVIEAAILATRTAYLPPGQIAEEFARLVSPVRKTGGPSEREAFALLSRFVQNDLARRGSADLEFPTP